MKPFPVRAARPAALVSCLVALSGCFFLHGGTAGHDRRAWAEAQQHAVLLNNPVAVGRVTSDGKQDAGTILVGVRSYSDNTLCFSVDADQRLWPKIQGFDLLVLGVGAQEESQALVQPDGVQSPVRTHTVVGTETEYKAHRDPELIEVDIPFEERAVCFSQPTILASSAAQMILRVAYGNGGHGYFAWRLTSETAPRI